jgi:transcriptional regulator with GAF, ATPase, and Fis domain
MARGLFVPELHNLFEVAMAVPPLRERPADVAMLAWYFLRNANPALALSGGALKTLSDYPFPGNVRELQNLITRLAIVPLASDSSVIGRPTFWASSRPPAQDAFVRCRKWAGQYPVQGRGRT